MINKWIGIGNLTRDPETTHTQKNTSLCKFGIALNRKWIGSDGQAQEKATFIECTAWGKIADVIQKYCHKGKQVCIEGYLEQERWTAEDGSSRQKLGVVVEKLEMLGGGQSNAPGHHGHYEEPQQPPRMGSTDEDIPF